ncbi:peptide N-acetyl-beta-D-glucosaminyl asparaginase amidase A-domain-containing protein [Nemania sp. FL0916]|nr:peptide N-acetyl-beta-D-glucosaminyl asparaginase amidase A-domain-containing protein [Nemania sp. FL0916]
MRTGLLSGVIAGAALAHADVRSLSGAGAIHPFAKYKNLALGEHTKSYPTPAPTSTPTRPLLECFQVAEPVLTPSGLQPASASGPQVPIGGSIGRPPPHGGASPCAVVLMEHTFANSYGSPFVGNYTPPKCDFDHVVINFTTLVKGRQYDRTGVMYLGDTEVWRTSTAEPTSYGIRWEWLKDMTAFNSLWKKPQTVIFDLENIVDSTYTGLLNTTLTATFFKAPVPRPSPTKPTKAAPADLIIPISQRLGAAGKPSQFVYPGQQAINTVTDFPRNANRAVFTVDVKGQGNEEFWWSNVLQSQIFAFNATYGQYPGYSPFREVQVLIDGNLAGFWWPYPVIYTGGVVPQLHRPIVGIQAFDISEHEIDISPFLPLLCDGKSHTFEIKIVGLVDNGGSSAEIATTTEGDWYITGKIFVWLDDADSITTGELGPIYTAPPTIKLTQKLTQNATGANETLDYVLYVNRNIDISAQVKTQKTTGLRKWTSGQTYANTGGVSGYGNNNINAIYISGAESTLDDSGVTYSMNFAYPLFSNSTIETLPQGNLTIWAQVDQGLQIQVLGAATLPTGLEGFVALGLTPPENEIERSSLVTQRNGTANYYRPGDNSYSTGAGSTHQLFTFGYLDLRGTNHPLYERDVSAFNDTVTADQERVVGQRGLI